MDFLILLLFSLVAFMPVWNSLTGKNKHLNSASSFSTARTRVWIIFFRSDLLHFVFNTIEIYLIEVSPRILTQIIHGHQLKRRKSRKLLDMILIDTIRNIEFIMPYIVFSVDWFCCTSLRKQMILIKMWYASYLLSILK